MLERKKKKKRWKGRSFATCKRILEIKRDDEKLNKDFFFDIYGDARKKKEKKVGKEGLHTGIILPTCKRILEIKCLPTK